MCYIRYDIHLHITYFIFGRLAEFNHYENGNRASVSLSLTHIWTCVDTDMGMDMGMGMDMDMDIHMDMHMCIMYCVLCIVMHLYSARHTRKTLNYTYSNEN